MVNEKKVYRENGLIKLEVLENEIKIIIKKLSRAYP